MTDNLVKQARKALEGATPGQWSVAEISNVKIAVRAEYRDDQGRRITSFPFECHDTMQGDMRANANFAAVAHDLMPAMADAIEALAAELAALRDREKAAQVKPLEWRDRENGEKYALDPFRGYYILDGDHWTHESVSRWFAGGADGAQADCERCILSALSQD